MDWLTRIKDAGVVGAGGAGFPAHVKLNTKQPMLIANGIECEPLLQTDKYLMRTYADALVEVIDFVRAQIGADRAVIGIKDKNLREFQALQKAIRAAGSSIEIKVVQNYYPAGDEHMLVQEVTGRSTPPGGIPLEVGAVVTNVATLLDIKNALHGQPVTSRVITVAGAVRQPKLIRVPIGTSIAECLALAEGTSVASYAVFVGGPLMGDECTREAATSTYVTKTTSGLVVLSEDSYLVRMRRLPLSHIVRRTASACIQCQMCTDLCPRYLNGHPLFPHKVMRAIGNNQTAVEALKSALLCCECGICEFYACPMGLSPKAVNQIVKKQLSAQGVRFKRELGVTCRPREMLSYRKIDTTRIMARTGLLKYLGGEIETIQNYEPKQVTIPLKQHVGLAAKPVVQDGAFVSKGVPIAKMEDGVLGADVHASISGWVTLHVECIDIDSREERHG